MRIRFPIVLVAAGLAGCAPYPNDVEGTLEQIEAQHRIRLGMVAIPDSRRPLASAFLARLAKATGAVIETPRTGPSEELFAALEAGQLDLVIAEVAEDSPWIAEVAVIEPLAERQVGERRLGLSPVARNGENRWIMLLEREARATRRGS